MEKTKYSKGERKLKDNLEFRKIGRRPRKAGKLVTKKQFQEKKTKQKVKGAKRTLRKKKEGDRDQTQKG